MTKSPTLRQIATERRKITRDDSDILERLIEERYDWLPADVAAGLRRRHLKVFIALWWRCEAEVRSAIAWRRAVRESGALKNAALGYWLLARFALAAASKLAGRAAIDNPASDLRRWLARNRIRYRRPAFQVYGEMRPRQKGKAAL